jgi:hypothetical protein
VLYNVLNAWAFKSLEFGYKAYILYFSFLKFYVTSLASLLCLSMLTCRVK